MIGAGKLSIQKNQIKGRQIYWRLFILLLINCSCSYAFAQNFEFKNSRTKASFPFKLIRNLLIVQLNINGNGPHNFIIDTGADFMVITDPGLTGITNTLQGRQLKLAGVGGGEYVDAFITMPMVIELSNLICHSISAAVLKEDNLILSRYVGIPVHGLLGYEFFKDLVLKINFRDSTITAFSPGYFKPKKKYVKVPMAIENNKPYIKAEVVLPDNSKKKCNLLVDLGAGHVVSLENGQQYIDARTPRIPANLGVGLTGQVSGSIGRIKELKIDTFSFTNVLAYFPDIPEKKRTTSVNGSLGVELLKRFALVFDYGHGYLYFKSVDMQKKPFEHDMSGLEYYMNNLRGVSHIMISRIEPGSSAEKAGLMIDDEIMYVNSKKATDLGFGGLDNLFRSRDGRNLAFEIRRNKTYIKKKLTLKKRI